MILNKLDEFLDFCKKMGRKSDIQLSKIKCIFHFVNISQRLKM